ncbi:hypothetical protein [Mucilaginibacter psychrotolerans]|uniref:Uncharacterized protein n=1 Tax=Mucilaginibacter psychrotolerans TaxID=1524096 RepID=A0A4Y8SEY6_9SPHI|nr:hypothetical protein [Mucilaginibacter psychrotolerans]TFF37478.1 hypothetical protein E2R66_11775 [Mucilaginibacter psychrotolerans]
MIEALQANFPEHTIISHDERALYVVDEKPLKLGSGIRVHITDPGVHHVYLHNPRQIPLLFDCFPENSFWHEDGEQCKQCECIIFPKSCLPDDWVLAVEAKYASVETAFKKEIDYPNIMVTQIIDTITFLRNKGVIPNGKTVKALVAFPKLIEDFNAFFFTNTPSVEDILLNHRILIRAANFASIRNNRKLYLGELRDFDAM